MHTLSAAVPYLGAGLGTLGAIVGGAAQGFESAVLWALVGYFLGKSIQSTLWTVTDERAT